MSENSTSKLSNTKFMTIIVIAVVALLVIANGFYIVSPQEEAVVLNFGKYHKTAFPGPHVKIPFVQKVYKVTTTKYTTINFGFRQKSDVVSDYRPVPEESYLLTGDSNILDIRWSIQYKINDPKNWLFNVYDDPSTRNDERVETIRDISFSVINTIIGDNSLDRIFEGDRNILTLNAKNEMNRRVKNVGLGIEVVLVEFDTVAAPSGAVQEAFNDVTAATVEKNRLIDEGNVYESTLIPKVKGEAERVKSLADGYALERVNLAVGDVAKFKSIYAEYRKNPSITRKRMYYEMMESLAKDSKDTELIDKDLSNFIPFKSLGGVQ